MIVHEGRSGSEPAALVAWLAAVGVELQRIGLEAEPLSPWLYEGLRKADLPAVCIETRRMKGAVAAMAVKTDRNDARAIAQAIRVGWYMVVHVKTAAVDPTRRAPAAADPHPRARRHAAGDVRALVPGPRQRQTSQHRACYRSLIIPEILMLSYQMLIRRNQWDKW